MHLVYLGMRTLVDQSVRGPQTMPLDHGVRDSILDELARKAD